MRKPDHKSEVLSKYGAAIGYRHVYLSPHYDDAALSCGGSISRQVQAGEPVLIVTVCTAFTKPGESLSSHARMLHESWGSPENISGIRQSEDRASMEILGTDFLYLNFRDAIYRGDAQQGKWFYTGDEDIFGQIHKADLTLAARIEETVISIVSRAEDKVIYAPLGIGNHVDHQLTHLVGQRLLKHGWTIGFYEDYPYSDPDYPFENEAFAQNLSCAQEFIQRFVQANSWKIKVQTFSEKNLEAKIESICAYASQLKLVFGSEGEMRKRVRKYALSVGAGQPAERIIASVSNH